MAATKINLQLGDTQLIIKTAQEYNLTQAETAYVLATVYHETAHTMRPVREYGGETYLKRKKYYPYVGMGYVQLTWRHNYEYVSKKLGVDFLDNPKLLLQSHYAVRILVQGMKEGWFTTKKLSNYFSEHSADYYNARRIINKMDKAQLIAGYALEYYNLLVNYNTEPEDMRPMLDATIGHPLPAPAQKVYNPGIWERAKGWLSSFFAKKTGE